MKTISTIIGICLAIFSFGHANKESSKISRITVVNATQSATFSKINMVPVTLEGWGENLIPDREIEPGEQVEFWFASGEYEILLTDIHSNTGLIEHIHVNGNRVVIIDENSWKDGMDNLTSFPPIAIFTIANNTESTTIRQLYISKSDESDWGTYLNEEVLEPGEIFQIRLNYGEYDIKLVEYSSSKIERRFLKIDSSLTLEMTESEWQSALKGNLSSGVVTGSSAQLSIKNHSFLDLHSVFLVSQEGLSTAIELLEGVPINSGESRTLTIPRNTYELRIIDEWNQEVVFEQRFHFQGDDTIAIGKNPYESMFSDQENMDLAFVTFKNSSESTIDQLYFDPTNRVGNDRLGIDSLRSGESISVPVVTGITYDHIYIDSEARMHRGSTFISSNTELEIGNEGWVSLREQQERSSTQENSGQTEIFNSGYTTISEISLRETGTSSWFTQEVELKFQETETYSIEPGIYDMRFTGEGYEFNYKAVRITENGVLVSVPSLYTPLDPDADAYAMIISQEPLKIETVFIRRSGDRSWGSNLRIDDAVLNENSTAVALDVGTYDLKIVGNDGSSCIMENVYLKGFISITIENDICSWKFEYEE